MGQDDVANALEAMASDMDVAERLATGDFTDLPDAELTEAERAMVIAAADDVPDVQGFVSYLKLGRIQGNEDAVIPKLQPNPLSPLGVATRYAFPKLDNPK